MAKEKDPSALLVRIKTTKQIGKILLPIRTIKGKVPVYLCLNVDKMTFKEGGILCDPKGYEQIAIMD